MSRIFKAGYALLALAALFIALLVGVVYGVALIGGGSFARSASELAGTLESVAIYAAAVAMLAALLSMYASGEHHLRIDSQSDD